MIEVILLSASHLMKRLSVFYTTPAFVAGILLLNLRPFVDKLFATHYFNSSEIVLTGTVNLITFIPECMVLSVSYAIQSLTSRHLDRQDGTGYLLSGLMLALVTMIPLLCYMCFNPVFFLRLVAENVPTDVQSLAFFRLRMVGCLFQCLIFCLRGFYSAYRNNRIFFSVIALSLIIHCLCNQLFLSGSWLIAPLGIQGMGLSYCIAMLFGLAIYTEQFLNDAQSLSVFRPRLRQYYQLLRFCLPLTFHGIIDHIGTTLIFTCTGNHFGLLPLASLHLVSSIQGISPGAGFGLTALTEVSRTYAKNSRLARRRGEFILLTGSAILGLFGLIMSTFAAPVLKLMVPDNLALQQASLLPLQLTMFSLFLHVGCQIVLKILQAIDQTVASVTINLSFIYGFRVPLLLCLGSIPNASIQTVLLILIAEKCLKLSAMVIYWRRKLSVSPQKASLKAAPSPA